jgi:phosphatidylserine/phosphatidylglycerophosphate/cardiolipin synthase-like enzyme
MTYNPSKLYCGDVFYSKLESAKKSIDLQIYALTDTAALKVLNQQSQDKNVTIYYDAKASSDIKKHTNPLISLEPAKTKALMHRKICIIDDSLAIIGSANYTTTSLFWHYNAMMGIQSEKLCSFLKERKKGSFRFEGGTCYLLPDIKNQALNHMISLINQAKDSIDLAIFSLTHPQILYALRQASDRGVQINLYIDQMNLKDPKLSMLETLQKCQKIYTQKNGVLLHHKLCFIDKKYVILGSSNWTKGGLKKNEEVLLIFDKMPDKIIQQLKGLFNELDKDLVLVEDFKLAS